MKKSVLLLTALLFSGTASSSQTIIGEVSRIYPANVNLVEFRLKNPSVNCVTGNGYYLFALTTNIEKAWYSMLLTAANTGKPIVVNVNSCPSAGSNTYINYLYQTF